MKTRKHCLLLWILCIFFGAAAYAEGQNFKKDYEALNGQMVSGHSGEVYQTLHIADSPQFVQITSEEAAGLRGSHAVLYMGAAWCPWCRNAIPSLMEAARKEGFSVIYYIDMSDERDTYEMIGGDIVKLREGTPGYQALVERLKEFLPEYTLSSSDGKTVEVGEKRIYLPTLAYLREDRFVSVMQPLAERTSEQTEYDPMSRWQQDMLTEQILSWFKRNDSP